MVEDKRLCLRKVANPKEKDKATSKNNCPRRHTKTHEEESAATDSCFFAYA
jgi:hypothetical protein